MWFLRTAEVYDPCDIMRITRRCELFVVSWSFCAICSSVCACVRIGPGETQGFYVTFTGDTPSMLYYNALEGSVLSQGSGLAVSGGVGVEYPFQEFYEPRIFAGSVCYRVAFAGRSCFCFVPIFPRSEAPWVRAGSVFQYSSCGAHDRVTSRRNLSKYV